jgi:hypothetical protein
MPGTGFEPAHLAAPPPEDGASTNFATRAEKTQQEKPAGCKYMVSNEKFLLPTLRVASYHESAFLAEKETRTRQSSWKEIF